MTCKPTIDRNGYGLQTKNQVPSKAYTDTHHQISTYIDDDLYGFLFTTEQKTDAKVCFQLTGDLNEIIKRRLAK